MNKINPIDLNRLSNVNNINKSNSNKSISPDSLRDKSKDIAQRVGDPEPFFAYWALQNLPEHVVEQLAVKAVEKGNNAPRLFNFLVRKEIKSDQM